MYFKVNRIQCSMLIHIVKPEYYILGKLKSGKGKETDGTRDTENTDGTSDADDTDDSTREYTKNRKTKEARTQKKMKNTKCVKGKMSENYEA